ncbi:10027_t:CDS:2, partial [Acaulospora morrowiae]
KTRDVSVQFIDSPTMKKVEMFFSPLTWFTYATIPIFRLAGSPVRLFSYILAIVFDTIQLWKAITPCSISNTTFSSNEISEDFEDFVSTREALKTIFPQSSNEEITKYEKQLSSVKNLNPVLIISANKTWINQHGLPAYHAVMDVFATNGLQNKRRDDFTTVVKLYTVRDNIRNLIPNAFFDQPSLQTLAPNIRLHPVGTVWILTKVGVHKSDFGSDSSFFLSH